MALKLLNTLHQVKNDSPELKDYVNMIIIL